ncbi:hypothetical protein C8Q76DRAFT_697740 [Earliella scabrosa]|nr:hypothetical protein C8Q76DRAFT_699358 [Earliella scabrosa]KAI0698854.1 hypothetical protein C8Q76DRAFT_698245 [Earliella scabrosa]KAI0702655.1 hypothetical protein C8Q76DRAFT_697740 [Earliella scabrosa]
MCPHSNATTQKDNASGGGGAGGNNRWRQYKCDFCGRTGEQCDNGTPCYVCVKRCGDCVYSAHVGALQCYARGSLESFYGSCEPGGASPYITPAGGRASSFPPSFAPPAPAVPQEEQLKVGTQSMVVNQYGGVQSPPAQSPAVHPRPPSTANNTYWPGPGAVARSPPAAPTPNMGGWTQGYIDPQMTSGNGGQYAGGRGWTGQATAPTQFHGSNATQFMGQTFVPGSSVDTNGGNGGGAYPAGYGGQGAHAAAFGYNAAAQYGNNGGGV